VERGGSGLLIREKRGEGGSLLSLVGLLSFLFHSMGYRQARGWSRVLQVVGCCPGARMKITWRRKKEKPFVGEKLCMGSHVFFSS